MALSVNTGSFSISATGSKSVTGVGFQPKLVIVWCQGAAGSVYHSFGMAASSTAEWCVSASSMDGQGAAVTASAGRNDATIYMRDGSTTYTLADFTSMDADGFTLNVSTSSGAQSFSYLCIGGSDLTNVKVGSTLVPASGATHAVTGVGFQADLYLFSMEGQLDWNATGTNASYGIGAMTATAQGAGWSYSNNTSDPTVTTHYQRDDSVALLATGSPPTQFLRWSKSSIGSDGFTLSLDDLGTASAEFGYAALKFTSSSWVKLGKETQPTSATTKQTTGLGLTPSGVMFFGCMYGASASPGDEAGFTIGAWDGTHNTVYAICDEDNVGVTNADRLSSTSKALMKIDGSAALLSEAAVSASDYGSFTLDWTTADATAREFFYVALGNPAAPQTRHPYVIGSLL